MFVPHRYVSNKRTLCFGQVIATVSNKRTPYLYFIATLVISGQSVLCFMVALVRSGHYIVLNYIATFEISARSVLYLIVTLVISAHYICTSLR